jgi:5'-nucleotidase
MKTIYVDLDGVVADFDSRYEKVFGIKKELVDRTTRNSHWEKFVKGNNFEELLLLDSAVELLHFLDKVNANVEILSSSGGLQFHDIVKNQKLKWLKKVGINHKANIVPGGMKKGEFANKNTILIDDTKRVVDNFVKNGGHAILHDHANVKSTIEQLKKFLNNKD